MLVCIKLCLLLGCGRGGRRLLLLIIPSSETEKDEEGEEGAEESVSHLFLYKDNNPKHIRDIMYIRCKDV